MITILFEKPNKSIKVIGYGVDSYKNKEGHEIWRVYGIVKAGVRGRLVSRDSTVVKDFYTDDTTVVIFRSSDKKEAEKCKEAIDKSIANKFPVFSVEVFKEWLKNSKEGNDKEETAVSDNAN